MTDDTVILKPFSFRQRPLPVPGDLRIGWRVALILLMLGHSRSQRASIAKLHILNDAIRSNAPDKLQAIVEGTASTLPWNLRVEPAFARAIDFAVGDKLAAWTRTADRAALQLTVDGSTAFESISKMPDALTSEKEVLGAFSKSVTESVVTAVLGSGRKAP